MEISVIIPMYNAENTIIESLRGLESQERRDFEVVVVDDGSTDTSPELVTEFGNQSKLPIRLLGQENAGPATARNLGAEYSNGRIIVFLDSDCIPPPNWIEAMTRSLGGAIVGCNCGYKVRNTDSLIARYVDYEIARRHEKMIGKNMDTMGSYSASFLKSVFTKVGGFDTGYASANAEDFDLAFNLRRMGYSLLFTGETLVYHYHPTTLGKYLKQQYGRGYWRVRLYLRNRDRIMTGDDYTGHEAQLQFILSNCALLSLPLMLVSTYSVAIGFGMLLISNLPVGLWAFRREKKFLLIAPVLASLRSLAGTIGAYAYAIQSIPKVLKELTKRWGRR